MSLAQQKMVAPGDLRRWQVDLEAMGALSGWSRRDPDMLRQEVDRLLEAFPTFVAALGRPLRDDQCWVEAAEPVTCTACDELVVFDRGTRCASCGITVEPPSPAVAGFVGRIPALLSGRPLERRLRDRIDLLRRRGDTRLPLFERSLIEVQGQTYLTPRFGLWLSISWPHSPPPVMVWPEYFDVLEIPPDHVYPADPYHRLCLYARWHEQPAVDVLQRRVAPRLLIDLMMADLAAEGKLDLALERLDASLYQVYNMVGSAEAGEPLRRIYDELVRT